MEVIQGDITRLKVDAVVNAANTSLMGGGGVDGAIHRAGGPRILEECRAIVARQGECKTGEAIITSGGNLPARFVIHTVGPVWSGQPEATGLLSSAYRNSLQLALDHGVASIAFPNISTGVYRFPKREAATIAVQAVTEFLQAHEGIQRVIFACFDDENYHIYKALLD